MKMKKLTLFLLLASAFTAANASDIIASNSRLYYLMNGGTDITIPSVTQQSSMNLIPDVHNQLGYTCDGFNPSITVNSQLNDWEDSVENVPSEVISNLSGYINGAASYLMDKADSIAYSLMQNSIEMSFDDFSDAKASCSSVRDSLKNGKSFDTALSSIAESQGWKYKSDAAEEGTDVDITDTRAQTAQDPYKYGVPWVDANENAGGTGNTQVPIHVLSDVVIAGYNVLIDDARDLNSQQAAPDSSELSKYWKNPQEAADWATLVLGDFDYSADTLKESTKPGMGLLNLSQNCPVNATNELTCIKTVQQKLVDVATQSSQPTAEQLQAISSGQSIVTPEIISDIKNLSKQDQSIVISKLGEDIALQNLVDEAKTLRHVIIAGKQTPPVQQLEPVVTRLDSLLQQLKGDIEDVTFDNKLNDQMMSKTISTIQMIETMNQQNASQIQEETAPAYTENGAHYKS